MLIEVKDRFGNAFSLNMDLIEAIYSREGNTSEIVTTTGNHYNSIESRDKLEKRINIIRQLHAMKT